MKVVPALGHHPEHLGVLVVAQADGARGRIGGRHFLGEGELGVGVDDALVDPDDGVLIVLLLLVVVVLGDEDDSGEDDAVGVVRVPVRVGRRVVVVAGDAAADVGSQEESGEEDEEAERNGDAVAESEGS